MFNNTYAKGVPGGAATHPSVANIAAPNRRVGSPFAGTYVRLSLRNPNWGGGTQPGGGGAQPGGGGAQPGGVPPSLTRPAILRRHVTVTGEPNLNEGRYAEIRRKMRMPWTSQN